MRESKLTITVTETEQDKVSRKIQIEHKGYIIHMLYAIPRFIAELEQSLPEEYQARFRAEFLEELNKRERRF